MGVMESQIIGGYGDKLLGGGCIPPSPCLGSHGWIGLLLLNIRSEQRRMSLVTDTQELEQMFFDDFKEGGAFYIPPEETTEEAEEEATGEATDEAAEEATGEDPTEELDQAGPVSCIDYIHFIFTFVKQVIL